MEQRRDPRNRIDPREYGQNNRHQDYQGTRRRSEPVVRSPGLKPEDTGGLTELVVVIASVRHGFFVQGRRGKRMVLDMEEYPDRTFWPSLEGIGTLLDEFGTDPDSWIGRQLPLVMVQRENPTNGEVVDKYDVAHPDDWEDILADAERAAAAADGAQAGADLAAQREAEKPVRKRK